MEHEGLQLIMQQVHSLSLFHSYTLVYFNLGVSDIAEPLDKLFVLLLFDSIFVSELIENSVGMVFHKHFKVSSFIHIVEVKYHTSSPTVSVRVGTASIDTWLSLGLELGDVEVHSHFIRLHILIQLDDVIDSLVVLLP